MPEEIQQAISWQQGIVTATLAEGQQSRSSRLFALLKVEWTASLQHTAKSTIAQPNLSEVADMSSWEFWRWNLDWKPGQKRCACDPNFSREFKVDAKGTHSVSYLIRINSGCGQQVWEVNWNVAKRGVSRRFGHFTIRSCTPFHSKLVPCCEKILCAAQWKWQLGCIAERRTPVWATAEAVQWTAALGPHWSGRRRRLPLPRVGLPWRRGRRCHEDRHRQLHGRACCRAARLWGGLAWRGKEAAGILVGRGHGHGSIQPHEEY